MSNQTPDQPVWFITGCSTGFGRALTQAALAHGFRVVATARDPKTLEDLAAGHEDNILTLALDVTKAKSNRSCG